MKKWVCPVCGYVYEGENPPAECPVCHVSGDKFTLQAEEKSWAAEHVVGVDPFRRGVAGGGTQAFQYGFPLGAAPCGVHGLRSFLVANNYRLH